MGGFDLVCQYELTVNFVVEFDRPPHIQVIFEMVQYDKTTQEEGIVLLLTGQKKSNNSAM